jgi:flagellar FliL protein
MATKTKDSEAKPKRGKLKMLIGALVLLGAGAGGAYAAGQMGYLGQASEGHEIDAPKLVRKGEADPYEPAGESKEGSAEVVEGEGGSAYRTNYFSFEETFTSNLKDSPALIQVNLAASTRRDGRVLQWLGKHELALRSVMLVELAETSEMEATTAAGKQRLQRRLTDAINKVLTDTEGFGGIDNVHFRGYLVQ